MQHDSGHHSLLHCFCHRLTSSCLVRAHLRDASTGTKSCSANRYSPAPQDDTAHGHTPWHWPVKWRKSQEIRAQDRTERQPTNGIRLAVRISRISAVRLGHALERKRKGQGDRYVLRAGPRKPSWVFSVCEGGIQSSCELPTLLAGDFRVTIIWELERLPIGFTVWDPLVEGWGCCCQPQTGPRGQAAAKADGTELTPEKITQQLAIGLWCLVVLGSPNFLSSFLRIFHGMWICTLKHGMWRIEM